MLGLPERRDVTRDGNARGTKRSEHREKRDIGEDGVRRQYSCGADVVNC
jgi:hypothetical protein